MLTLVTGATGFIGSAVVRALLARGRAVRCMVMPGDAQGEELARLGVEVVTADVASREQVARAVDGCQVVYHLAALYKLWVADPLQLYRVNVEGTWNVLFAAQRAGVKRVIHTSSIAAIGHHEGRLSDETTPFNQWNEGNDYIRSKWLSERVARAFAAEGLPVVIVNPSFPLGQGDRVPTPTGRMIVELMNGRLPGYTRGGINVVDVDDCAEGHLRAEERGRVGERYILGSHNVSHRDLARAVARQAGLGRPLVPLPAPIMAGVAWCVEHGARLGGGEPPYTYQAARFASRHLWFDVDKATRELAMPHRPLADTIAASVRWFRDHGYR